MKALITAAALASVIALPSSAFAAKAQRHFRAPEGGMVMSHSPAVYDGNRYMGADPDPNVRLQLMRDAALIDGGA
jgi:hypothetical protein